MNLEGTWPVTRDGQQVGQCTIARQGLYWLLTCDCGPADGHVLRLMTRSPQGPVSLGIPVPEEGVLRLCRKIPGYQMPQEGPMELWLTDCNHPSEPVPQPMPEPMPEPTPEPMPEPMPEPVPEPTPEPTPEPMPEPTPEPMPEPNPEPAADGQDYDPNMPIAELEKLDQLRAWMDSDGDMKIYPPEEVDNP